MKIKKGDNVIVVAGKDKGTTGKVLRAFPALDQVLLTGVNVKKRHQKATRSGAKGQILDIPHPIHVSNVMIVDPDTSKGSRVGKKLSGDSYVRISKKSGKTI